MGDQQGRDSRARQALAQDGGNLGGGLDVEGSRGFVEDENLGAEDEGACDRDAGGLATRQVGGALESEVRDPHGAQLFEGGGPGLRAPHPAHAQGEGDVGQDAHVGEDAGCLGDHGDAASACGHERGGIIDDSLADADGSAIHTQGPGDHLGERRLSGAVVANNGGDEAGAKLRVHVPAARFHGSGDAHGHALALLARERRGRGGTSGRSGGSGSALGPRDTKERGEPSPRGFRERDDDGRDAEEDHAEREGQVRVGLAGQVDLEGHRAGDALHGSGEGEGRAERAEASGQREGGAAPEAGQDRGKGDLPEDARRRGTQGGGHLVESLLAGAQRGLEGDDEEGQGDEDLRDDDGGRREGDVEAGAAQERPEGRAPAKGRKQRDAGDDGRQRERQGDEDAGGAHAPPGAGQHEGRGDAEKEVHAERYGARAQR